ncbi:glycosyltransferase [Roseiarcaceae bacterium H3SJ34-1]|uniref:glycosyltransferase n=1 Tax=Terripilifer ovatus TaxID=3032367 RepID=UPI003AB95AB5|nr:glycosyltransferase [Roseiarcaceae bacterium H3SJ34-1]
MSVSVPDVPVMQKLAQRGRALLARLAGVDPAKGDAYFAAGRWRKARKAYQTDLLANTQDHRIWRNAGISSENLGRFEEAAFCYRRAVGLDERDADALSRLGALQLRDGKILSAKSNLARAGLSGGEMASPQPRIFFDLTDLLVYLRQNVRITGMQRLQTGVFTSLIERGIGHKFEYIFYDDARKELRQAFSGDICELIDFLAAAPVSEPALKKLLDAIAWGGRPVTCRKNDIVMVLGAFWIGGGYLPLLNTLRVAGVRLGVYFHDLIPFTHEEFVTATTRRDFMSKLRDVLAILDFACTNSVFVENELRKVLLSLSRDDVPMAPVPLAHDIVCSKRDDPDETSRRTLPTEFVLCVGTIEKRKNHILLLKIWQRLNKKYAGRIPALVLAGKWGWRTDEFRNGLKASNNVDGKIVVLGNVGDDELVHLYKHCLFTVFPSFAEGWGLPVGESLFFGAPCIASNSTSIPEVGGSLVRYFDPRQPDEATSVIEQAVFDRPGLASWAERVRTEFRARTWDDVTCNLIDKIHTLADQISDRKRSADILIPSARVLKFSSDVRDLTPADLRRQTTPQFALKEGWYANDDWGCWAARPEAFVSFATDLPEECQVSILLCVRISPPRNEGSIVVHDRHGGGNVCIDVKLGRDVWVKVQARTDAKGAISLRLEREDRDFKHAQPNRRMFFGLLALCYFPSDNPDARLDALESVILANL